RSSRWVSARRYRPWRRGWTCGWACGSEVGIALNMGWGTAEPRQDPPLLPFHRLGLAVRFVIVSQKVEKAMQRQVGEVMVERLAFRARLARRGLVGDDDVAKVAGGAAARRRRRERE